MKPVVCFAALLIVSCGSTVTCDAQSCASGCCDSNGTCRPGTAASACGKSGAVCSSCTSSCTAGVCDGATGGSGGGSGAGGGNAGSGGGGNPGSGGGSTATGGSGAPASAVVNELVARGGSEYVELYNPGDQPMDLSNFGVTDSHDDGGPDHGNAVRFAAGTTLASHAFTLIMCGRPDAGTGTTTDCAGGSTCWEATWSVSNSKGETVWILDSSDQVADQAHYPIGGADAGRSYGRLPDGTGSFQEMTKTPAAPNMP